MAFLWQFKICPIIVFQYEYPIHYTVKNREALTVWLFAET